MSAIGYFKTPGIVWARPVYTQGYILTSGVQSGLSCFTSLGIVWPRLS